MAKALADWLPNVVQAVKPWFSSEHLQKGSRWAEELFSVLENSRVGVLCITPSNVHSPWVSFEAAACSTKVGGRVFTLLHRIPSAEVNGPLGIFNHTVSEHDDMLRLVRGINAQLDLPLPDAQLQKAFDRWWPDLEIAFSRISPDLLTAKVPARDPQDIASETLNLARHLSEKVEHLVELANPVDNRPTSNPNQTRELELEIDGVVERARSMRYPPTVQEVALQLVELLAHMFERSWFNKGEPPPYAGVAIARTGQLIFRFKFWHNEDASAYTIQRFFVQLEGDTGLTWHGSTNVAARG